MRICDNCGNNPCMRDECCCGIGILSAMCAACLMNIADTLGTDEGTTKLTRREKKEAIQRAMDKQGAIQPPLF